MTELLLPTKLYIPPLRLQRVRRPHLIDQLNQGKNSRLTLVSAAAGYGKTTLIVEWVQQVERPVSWLSLDEGDNIPERFLAYLAATLQQNGVDWQATSDAQLASLVNALVETQSPLLLVLDDYHFITETAVHEIITFLLEYAPPTFHLVITSRIDPPLPLSRLYARNQINEIRTLDLLFNEMETATFLNQLNDLNLSPEDIKILTNRTEGWATGIQLAALSLHRLTPTERHNFTRIFAGDDRYILDYLISEVLQQQSPERQTFLLDTSCLTELSAELCTAVTGLTRIQSQNMLEELEQENLFVIPLDNRRRWYRYHHLFSDLLQEKLAATKENAAVDIHKRASRWYAAQQNIEAAVYHSLAAADFTHVADLLETPDLLSHVLPDQILNWLDRLPPFILIQRPKLAIRRLWVLLNNDELDAVEEQLDMLAEIIAKDPELALESLVIRTQLAHRRQDAAASIALGEKLLSLLPEKPTPESLALQLGGLFGLGEAYFLAGNFSAAYDRVMEAIRVSDLAGNDTFKMRGRLLGARVLIAQENFTAAISLLETVLTEETAVHHKEVVMAEELLAQIPSRADSAATTTFGEALTAREMDVLRLLDTELSTPEIGTQLFISTNTVKTHLKNLYAKLGARSRYEAVAKAQQLNIL